MIFKDATKRIKEYMAEHNPSDPDTANALDMATRLLLWMDEQPEFILECNIIDLINEYYTAGLHDGFSRAKRVYKIKD